MSGDQIKIAIAENWGWRLVEWEPEFVFEASDGTAVKLANLPDWWELAQYRNDPPDPKLFGKP